MELGIKGIVGTWGYFGKNPVLATRILIDLAGAKLLRPFNPAYMRYERDLEELKRMYPGMQVQRVAAGTAVLQVLLFSALYSFLYLTYGVVWY